MRMAQDPVSDLVFHAQNDGPHRSQDIMQRDRDDRREDVEAEQPGNTDGNKRLQPEKRSESEKNPHRHPSGNSMLGILQFENVSNFPFKKVIQLFEKIEEVHGKGEIRRSPCQIRYGMTICQSGRSKGKCVFRH